ncbi:MAG TPA: hypothetical protein VGS20_06105 [Candidatus Acidoferrales bacterium]|nr:hypothetical protein [Candidatus Acidoferrales bacterium]
MNRRYALLAAVLAAAGLPGTQARGQDRPLQTPDAQIVPTGTLRVQAGFDFLQSVQFPLSGLSGDLIDAGALDLRLGVGRIAELQVQGTVEKFLQVNAEAPAPVVPQLTGRNSTHDVGDFSLWTKLRLLGEHRAPGLAFRFGFEMPNSNQARGIGNNATNVYASAIAEKHFGRLAAFGNAGVGILTSPNAKFSQNDVLIYGGAFTYQLLKRMRLAGEVAGRYSSRTITPALAGTESRGQGRMGLVISAWGFDWDAAAVAGVYANDPSSGFTFGVSRDLKLFGRRGKGWRSREGAGSPVGVQE